MGKNGDPSPSSQCTRFCPGSVIDYSCVFKCSGQGCARVAEEKCASLDWCQTFTYNGSGKTTAGATMVTLKGARPGIGEAPPVIQGGGKCFEFDTGSKIADDSGKHDKNKVVGSYDFNAGSRDGPESFDSSPTMSQDVVRVDQYSIHGLNFVIPRNPAIGLKRPPENEYYLDDILYRSVGQWVPPHTTALDIGANIGDTTIPIGLFAEKTIAFEPLPEPYDAVYSQIAANPHLNIDLHRVALTDKEGMVSFDANPFNGGIKFMDGQTESYKLPGVNAIEYMREKYTKQEIDNIGMIKIDVEGYDMHLLKILQPLLDSMPKKPIIKVEWFKRFIVGDSNSCSHYSRLLFDTIQEIGYEPRNQRTNQKMEGCANRFFIPDLVLVPLENAIMKDPIEVEERLVMARELQGRRAGALPQWLRQSAELKVLTKPYLVEREDSKYKYSAAPENRPQDSSMHGEVFTTKGEGDSKVRQGKSRDLPMLLNSNLQGNQALSDGMRGSKRTSIHAGEHNFKHNSALMWVVFMAIVGIFLMMRSRRRTKYNY